MSDSQDFETVMVLGGRGNLGPRLICALASAGFQVTVLSRSPPASDPSSSIHYAQSDYTHESLTNAFIGQDAVISTIATHDVHVQRTIVDACVAAGVRRFLPSEFGSDTSVVGEDEKAGFLKCKRDVLEYVTSKEKEGLEWTALYTGGWIDWLLQEGFLSWDLKTKRGILYDAGSTTFTVSTLSTVIRAIVAVLLKPGLTKNQYVHVSSFDLTQNMILESLERISGTKFQMQKMSLEDLYAMGEKHVDEGRWEAGYGELVAATIYSGSVLVCFGEKTEKWNKLLGVETGETLDEMIERVLKTVEK